MSAGEIHRDIEEFQLSVKKLSSGINGASALWNDKKFLEISASVREIALMSKQVILSGEHCCSSLRRFEAIAEERY